MPSLAERTLAEVWAWFTSARMQLILGGFLLLYFREHIGIDQTTADFIRQSVVAAVIGISVRDILQPQPQLSIHQPPANP